MRVRENFWEGAVALRAAAPRLFLLQLQMSLPSSGVVVVLFPRLLDTGSQSGGPCGAQPGGEGVSLSLDCLA